MGGKSAFNKKSGSVVGGSPSNSIATKHGGKTFSKGGHGKGGKSGNAHGPRGRKM